jgi:hypothetical protein
MEAFHGNTGTIMRREPPELDLDVHPSVSEGTSELAKSLATGPEAPEIEDSRDEVPKMKVPKEPQILEGEPESEDQRPAMLIDGVGAIGRRITHIRRYPDGTVDVIYVES